MTLRVGWQICFQLSVSLFRICFSFSLYLFCLSLFSARIIEFGARSGHYELIWFRLLLPSLELQLQPKPAHLNSGFAASVRVAFGYRGQTLTKPSMFGREEERRRRDTDEMGRILESNRRQFAHCLNYDWCTIIIILLPIIIMIVHVSSWTGWNKHYNCCNHNGERNIETQLSIAAGHIWIRVFVCRVCELEAAKYNSSSRNLGSFRRKIATLFLFYSTLLWKLLASTHFILLY